MKRIYLDWNVLSNLKRPQMATLRELLLDRLDNLLIPYTDAHFKDLMKSADKSNPYFDLDIKTIKQFCKNHLLEWDIDKGIKPSRCDPEDYVKQQTGIEDYFELMNYERLIEELNESGDEIGQYKIGDLLKKILQLTPVGISVDEKNEDVLSMMFPNLRSDSSIWDLMKDVGPFSKKLLTDRDFYKKFRKYIHDNGVKVESNSGNLCLPPILNQ